MEIKGNVHCFFEQSGTFKNEFIKLGYNAFDYDIQNNFNQTDFVSDLFTEIDNAYENKPSIFDKITSDDLIIAFYPCIYFCEMSQTSVYLSCNNYRKLTDNEKIKKVLEFEEKRTTFYNRLVKFCGVCINKKIRMIFENPFSQPHYLKNNFLKKPDIIDDNRMLRGDYFRKPTAYWFWNCKPTHGFTYQNDKEQKIIAKQKSGIKAGICSEERSLLSPDYARNFICDFIIGKHQEIGQISFEDFNI